jgi:hypothetical protein
MEIWEMCFTRLDLLSIAATVKYCQIPNNISSTAYVNVIHSLSLLIKPPALFGYNASRREHSNAGDSIYEISRSKVMPKQ